MGDSKDVFAELADESASLHRDWVLGVSFTEEMLKRGHSRLEAANTELERLATAYREREAQVARAEETIKQFAEGVTE